MMADTKKTAGAPAPASELEAKVAILEQENAALKAELKDAAEVVADLKEQLADKATAGVLTVKVSGKKYRVVGGCVLAGKRYTKQDIAADAKIAEQLIKKGSQLVIPN